MGDVPAPERQTYSSGIVSAECHAVWQQLLDDENPCNWCIWTYSKVGPKNVVALSGSGVGGMHQMIQSLSSGSIQFAGFRITGLDPRGSLVQRRSKFCKVFFQSDSAPPMQKGKAARDKGEVFHAMSSCHIEMNIPDVTELTEDAVVKMLKQCGGAHQPTQYEFS